MIKKSEIFNHARTTGLLATVIEKDYVLGWVLAGIFHHPAIKDSWIFKGGTCLKKCYFETYRFSEDLDFTLVDKTQLEQKFLISTFKEISEWVYEQSGIQLPADKIEFEIYHNTSGKTSCQGKLSYLGPIAPTSVERWPRIKLDLTAEELLVDIPTTASIYHPYSDLPANGFNVLAYSHDEVFAEKTRALAERTRPRDLYDVINLFRQPRTTLNHSKVLEILRKKCEFKNIATPTYASLESHYQECYASWNDQLAHQIVTLPPFDSFWNELPKFFDWLYSGRIIQLAKFKSNEHDFPALKSPNNSQLNHYTDIDKIRFAAASRLCLELTYQKENGEINQYLIEPYSLRVSANNDILLFGLKYQTHETRAFEIDRIHRIHVRNQTFVPKYEIEIFPRGRLKISSLQKGL